MRIARTSHTAVGPSAWFTGAGSVDPGATPSGGSRLNASRVRFTPGAHRVARPPNGQTRCVTEGVGLVRGRGGPVEGIRPGDRVVFESGEDHWHSAAPTCFTW